MNAEIEMNDDTIDGCWCWWEGRQRDS